MTNASSTVELINHAALQNDRWLMVAMVFVLIGCAAFCVRWMAQALERMEAKSTAERAELLAAHNAERKEQFEVIRQLQSETKDVVRDNTSAFTRNQEVLDRVMFHLNAK